MAFSVKSWQNSPNTTTPISAAALQDLETRLSNFSRLNATAVVDSLTPHTAVDGELSITSTGVVGITITLPSPANNSMVGVVVNSIGITPVTVTTPSGVINGKGISAATITLLSAGDFIVLLSDGTNWYIIAGAPGTTGTFTFSGTSTTSSTTYTTMPTHPDQVQNIVLPTNGLIRVWYQAVWQNSAGGGGTARAAIFLGANQLKTTSFNNIAPQPPVVQEVSSQSDITAGNNDALGSTQGGLGVAGSNGYTGDVTTGQVAGIQGPCDIFAAAGTYTVSVQFKVSSGSVTVSNRTLRVQALTF